MQSKTHVDLTTVVPSIGQTGNLLIDVFYFPSFILPVEKREIEELLLLFLKRFR